LQAFTALIDSTRNLTLGLTLREIIEQILDVSGLSEFYRNDKDGADRLENLGELINAAEAFVTQEGFGKDAVALPVDELSPGAISEGLPNAVAPAPFTPDAETGEIMSPLAAFLTHASLEAGDNQAQAGQDAIQLMTVHSAKGLEFDAVFITGLEEGLFPHENALNDSDGVEEERRLMYVAITRARQRLYICFSQTRMLHGQTRYNVKSRFLSELPEAALKWLTPQNQGFGSGFAKEYQSAWERGSGLKSMVGAGRSDKPAYAAAPMPTSMVKKVDHEHGGLTVGKGVFHTKFGEGVLITLEGKGADARAQVNFGRHGMKWLALSIAKLTPID